MKTLHTLLFTGVLSLCCSATATAQQLPEESALEPTAEMTSELTSEPVSESMDNTQKRPDLRGCCDEQKTTVFVIGAPMDEMVKVRAIEYFRRTLRPGPQQVGMPRFMITDKANRASFAIGGFVNFRTAYDFNNEVQNLDFVTYDIPMVSTPANHQRLLMDGSISRLYFKSLINTRRAGPIEAYIEADFRGAGYTLRLREAYVSVMGFLAGQTTTTFCDLEASPNTIDFEGPNGYTYGRNLMVRYQHTFDKHWSAALAVEYPTLSATPGANSSVIPQRIPDIPAYVQYAWNDQKSHLRLSGVMRNMNYYDKVNRKVEDAIGYGVQLSSVVNILPWWQMTGQLLYGEGITTYIQDLQGSGLDLLANVEQAGRLNSVPAMSWLISTQFNFTKKLAMTAGYSQVHIWNNQTNLAPSDYKLGQYVVTNLMYNVTPYLTVGAEYLYGTRIDQNNAFGKANRAQVMVQYNF